MYLKQNSKRRNCNVDLSAPTDKTIIYLFYCHAKYFDVQNKLTSGQWRFNPIVKCHIMKMPLCLYAIFLSSWSRSLEKHAAVWRGRQIPPRGIYEVWPPWEAGHGPGRYIHAAAQGKEFKERSAKAGATGNRMKSSRAVVWSSNMNPSILICCMGCVATHICCVTHTHTHKRFFNQQTVSNIKLASFCPKKNKQSKMK